MKSLCWTIYTPFWILLIMTLSGVDVAAEEKYVSGTALYREKILLRPGSIFEASLEDVSRADAAAEIIGQVTIENPAGSPIAFQIPYDPDQIDERFSYNVRARVTRNGKLLMTTDSAYPVLTRGNSDQVELLLVGAAGQSSTHHDENKTTNSLVIHELVGTRWVLIQLRGESVVGKGSREAFIYFAAEDNKISGFSGCNTFVGEYRVEKTFLKVDRVAMTSKACIGESMEVEKVFRDILPEIQRYRIQGRQLDVFDGDSVMVARFEERNL